jgi:phosphatidylglycerol---prolipoprotein diacylglyceryl transferase
MTLFPTRQIIISLGPLAIHWYGVMYLLAFLLAWKLIPFLAKKKHISFSQDDVSNILFAGILGVLIGGRFGYIIFYGAEYYGKHPWEMFAVWKGGMSSHGGFIGVAITMLIVFNNLKGRVTIWQLGDLIVVPVAIGLALGRVGNFINLELYGPVTHLPWAISIPGVEGLRHPTPLYAAAKDLLIAGVCFFHLMKSQREGTTLGIFLILYGILRFLIENVRMETAPGFDLGILELTRGQMLTIPIFIIGLIILWKRMSLRATLPPSQ